MDKFIHFAIVGLESLEGIALKRIVNDDLNAHAVCFPDFISCSEEADRFDAFVTDAETLLAYPDFFMTRKNRVAVVSDADVHTLSGFTVVSRKADESGIINSMRIIAAATAAESKPAGALSSREIDVLREVASGKTNKEIADSLCISINTVITHRRNISTKLGIRSASGLSLYAMMNGFI